jgi:phage gp29-like protein
MLLSDAIEQRDPVVKNVANKRKKAVASLSWEIIPEDDSAEAAAHQAALKAFYDRLEVRHALDQDQAGGVDLLVKQMADAIGKKYAVHEILLRPGLRGGELSAQLNFCPPWFFESRSGRLRYLTWDFNLVGIEMPAAEWLVTVADDVLMEPTSVAYLYKQSSLRDWVNFTERFGMPFLLGKTPAAEGSEQWEQMLDMVRNFAGDGGGVVNEGASIEPVTVTSTGDQPHAKMIQYMDEKIIQLWRGGDLSTASKGQESTGASLQGEETDLLLVDDAKLIAGTLRLRLDTVAIAYKFGEGTKPKAHFTLVIPDQQDTNGDIAIDRFLLSCGVKLSVSDALRRYGRAEAEGGERALTPAAPPVAPPAEGKLPADETRRRRSRQRRGRADHGWPDDGPARPCAGRLLRPPR